MNIQDRLKEIRKQKGISQKQVADFAGLSVAAYSNIESGISKSITIEAGKGIAKALGIPFNELFEIEVSVTNASEAAGELEKLREQIKELEKWIETKDKLINLLQRENKDLYYKIVHFELFRRLDYLYSLNLRLTPSSIAKNHEVDVSEQRSYIEFVKEYINGVLEEGKISRIDLIEIVIDFDLMVVSKNKSMDNIKEELTSFLKHFLEVTPDEIEQLALMYKNKVRRIIGSFNDMR